MLSENSIIAYQKDIEDLLHFMNSHNLQLKTITKQNLREYFAYLAGRGISRSTQARKVSAIKHFFKFCNDNDLFENNPTSNLLSPRKPQNMPKFLNSSQTENLFKVLNTNLDATRDADDINAKHLALLDLAIVEVLYSSGLRVSELVKLNWQDIDYKQGTIFVHLGKGAKDRIVPVTRNALNVLQALHQFLNSSATIDNNSNAVFIYKDGDRITDREVRRRLDGLGRQSGIGRLHPHMLRHTIATHLVDRDVDIRFVQDLLGHSALSTTQKYTHTSFERLSKVYNRAFPQNF